MLTITHETHRIRQFPSVLVRLSGRASSMVDEFDTFVQPTLNPLLTKFSIDLTAIRQVDVDAAPTIAEAMLRYLDWLRGHGLVDSEGRRLGHWAFCTWTDADIGGVHERGLEPRVFKPGRVRVSRSDWWTVPACAAMGRRCSVGLMMRGV